MEKKREKVGSRLGFILLSAGCAIGLGNVYRFPIITGAYGGAIFVLIYLAFLVLLGLPVMMAELAVGRGSQRSVASSFDALEKPGHKWHLWKYGGIVGNYMLMSCYTVVTGYMLIYFWRYLTGTVTASTDSGEMMQEFVSMYANASLNVTGAYIAIILGLLVCSFGLQKGVERVTKVMMIFLLALITGLAIYALTLPGAITGLSFYLVPNVENIAHAGILNVISAAMGQAFFTLSIGIGSIAIFGSYIGKDRSLFGESVTIIGLDTFVALMSGLIIFPAYFTFNSSAIEGEGGAAFLFSTLTAIFNNMQGGRIFGTLFFLFMSFAAMSTVIAVFENITSFWIEKTNLSRPVISIINIVIMMILVLPAAFSGSILSDIKIFGMTFDNLEDYIISNLLLPVGSLVYTVFCTWKFGWGWQNYEAEVNAGNGAKMPKWVRPYMQFVLPLVIFVIIVISVF